MNKKFKILMLTLIFISSTSMTSGYSAAGLTNNQNSGFFTSVGDFFGHLFGGEQVEAYENSLTKGGNALPVPEAAPTGANTEATNTAYGESDGEIEQGTGAIPITKDLKGIVIDKSMEGADSTYTCTDGTNTVPCVEPNAPINVTLTVTNTGLSTESVTVKDPLDAFAPIYTATSPVTLAAVGTDNGSAMAYNPTAFPAGTATIGDLTTTGIIVDNVDAGDSFTLSFEISTYVPEVKLPMDDFDVYNGAQACMAYEFDNGYTNVHNNGFSYDGIIFDTDVLCAYDATHLTVDADGDNTITIPDIANVESFKFVSDSSTTTTGNNVADPSETLTYTVGVATDVSTTLTIKDTLTEQSFVDNISYTAGDDIKVIGNGVITSATSGSSAGIPTIEDLQSGIKVDMPGPGIEIFQFQVTVKSAIVYDNLVNYQIENKATVTDDTKTETVVGDISVNALANTIVIEKSIDATEDGVYNTGGEVVDATAFGTTPGTAIPTTKKDIDYKIEVTNISGEDVSGLTIKDILPVEGYLEDASANALTVTPSSSTVTGTTSAGALVSDLVTGVTADIVSGDTVTFDFSVALSDDFYSDIAAAAATDKISDIILPDYAVFTNTATVSDATTTLSDSAWGSLNASSATGSSDFTVTKTLASGSTLEDGGVAKYNIQLDNDSDNKEVYALYDAFDYESSFDYEASKTNDLTLSSSFGAAKFVTNDTGSTEVATTPKVQDLKGSGTTTVVPGVFVSVPGNSSAVVSFDIKLKNAIPISPDTGDKLVNGVVACIENEADLTPSVALPKANCSGDTDVQEIAAGSIITVDKSVVDADASGVADNAEALNYTIAIGNTSTSGETIDYNLKDYMTDPNIDDFSTVNVTVDLDTDSNPTNNISVPFTTFTSTGYDRTGLVAGNTDTYTFTLTTIPSVDITQPDVVNNACGQITNVSAAARFEKADTRKIGDSDCDIEKIPTSSTSVDNTPTTNVSKVMSEAPSTSDNTNNGNGVIDAGEEIQVKFILENLSTTDSVVISIAEETLENGTAAFDPNIDWLSATTQDNELLLNTVEDATAKFVTNYSGLIPTTSNPTVANLVKADALNKPVPNNPVYVELSPSSSANITFNVETFDTTSTPAWTPAAEIKNDVKYCENAATACDHSEGIVDTIGFEDLTVTKNVTNSIAADTTTVNTGLDVDGNSVLYATDGGTLTYEVIIENTGSIDFTDTMNFKINDEYISDFAMYYDVDADVAVSGKEYITYVGAGASGNVEDATTQITFSGLTMNTTNGTEVSLPTGSTFESGNSLVFNFTIPLADNLSDFLVENNTVPNVVTVCYDSAGLSLFENVANGDTVCYSGSSETPYGDEGTSTIIDADDPEYAVTKSIADENGSTVVADGDLDSGDNIVMNIDITNIDPDNSEENQQVLLTDEFLDENFDYEATISDVTNYALEVYDITGVPAGQMGDPANYNYSNVNAGLTAAGITSVATGTTSVPAQQLLPTDLGTTGDPAYDRWNTITGSTGGIYFNVPANHTYRVVIHTKATGELKTATKVQNFFDIRRFFR